MFILPRVTSAGYLHFVSTKAVSFFLFTILHTVNLTISVLTILITGRLYWLWVATLHFALQAVQVQSNLIMTKSHLTQKKFCDIALLK